MKEFLSLGGEREHLGYISTVCTVFSYIDLFERKWETLIHRVGSKTNYNPRGPITSTFKGYFTPNFAHLLRTHL